MTLNTIKEHEVFTAPHNKNAYALAAYIAHPHLNIPENLVNDAVPVSELQQVLVANKVLFRSFTQHDFLPSSQKSNVVARLIRNSKEMSLRYEFYKVLKDELLNTIRLLNNDVQTIFIKSSNILPLDSDNFDILVHDDEMELADRVLRRNGFSVVKIADEPFKVLYRKTKGGKDYLALHLHTRVAWGGVEFLETEDIWKKHLTKDTEGVDVGFMSPEHHVPVTLAHAFFENASLKLSDIVYLVDSVSNNESSLREMISSSQKMGWDDVFCAMLLSGNSCHSDIYGLPIIPATELDAVFLELLRREKIKRIKALYGKMKTLRKGPFLPVSIPLRSYRGRHLVSQVVFNDSLSLSDKVRKLRYLFSAFLGGTVPRPKRPIIVSFIGVDSAGKTTHARKIVDAFVKRGYDFSYFWSRGSFRISEPVIGLAKSLLSSGSTDTSRSGKLSEARVEHMRTIPFFGKMLVTLQLFEHAAQIRSRLLFRRFSNDGIVFDRYLHDTVVDSLLHYGQDYNSFFSKLMLSKAGLLVSRPDLFVVFRASPQTISRRRPEENFEAIKQRSRIYESWSKRWGAYLIDTERYDIEQNHLRLLENALRLFYEGGV